MGWGILGGLGQGLSSAGQDLTVQARDERIQQYKKQESDANIKRQDSLLQQKLSREDRVRAEDQARADAQAKSAAEYQAAKDTENKRRWEIEQRDKISGEKWQKVDEPILDEHGNVVFDVEGRAQTRTAFVNHASGEKRYLDDYGSPGGQTGPAPAGSPATPGAITQEQVAAFREKNPDASWQDLSTLMKQRGVEVDPQFETMFNVSGQQGQAPSAAPEGSGGGLLNSITSTVGGFFSGGDEESAKPGVEQGGSSKAYESASSLLEQKGFWSDKLGSHVGRRENVTTDHVKGAVRVLDNWERLSNGMSDAEKQDILARVQGIAEATNDPALVEKIAKLMGSAQ